MILITRRFIINLIMYALVAITAGSIVYVMQSSIHNHEAHQQQQESDRLIESYKGNIRQLSKYIHSLKSRVQHLSVDNLRLSETSTSIVSKMEQRNIDIDEKRINIDMLQQEVVALDNSIIEKYSAYIAQQETCTELKITCKKGSNISKKCQEYQDSLDYLDAIGLQIKYLKAKREVLVSNLERTEATL